MKSFRTRQRQNPFYIYLYSSIISTLKVLEIKKNLSQLTKRQWQNRRRYPRPP